MAADDYDSWQETVYLLRSPQNARRLMEAVTRDGDGEQLCASCRSFGAEVGVQM